jgi:chloramphenicol 3-O-phosphotransferase
MLRGKPMPKLIIINGAPSVGKSAVANSVFPQLPNSAFLDGDDVWRINPFEVTEQTKAIVERNIPFVLRSYLEAGYEYVLLAWVMHRQEIIDRVVGELSDLDFELHVFTLVAEESVLQDRWRRLTGSEEDSSLVADRLRQSRDLDSTKIDTTGLSADQTARRIVDALS